MECKVMRLADIVPAEYNPRVTLTEADFEYKALKASIDEFGLVVPLVVKEIRYYTTGKGGNRAWRLKTRM